MKPQLCRCGSGLDRYQLNDAAGIFCCYVCHHCEVEKRNQFNPAIFDTRSRYAATGEEADIECDLHTPWVTWPTAD